MEGQIPLSQLARRLAALPGVRTPPPSYRELYNLVVDGTLAEAEYRTGRWYFAEDQLPAIALKLGLAVLTPAEPALHPRRRRTETEEPAAAA
jgi:hypothetical protein